MPRDDAAGADEPDHWFEPLADHLGAAYLRYSFTKGTEQEVDHLVDVLSLDSGSRVLDVGCGPGRHAHALARRGIEVLGVDISQTFVDLATEQAPAGAVFERRDARALGFDAEFDAAISLCQGAFGLCGTSVLDGDSEVLEAMAQAVRPGGFVAVSAFSAYFQLRYLEDGDSFDAEHGVNHERTTILDPSARPSDVDLWTTCFTPRELRLLAERADLDLVSMHSVTPGDYGPHVLTIDRPELLMIGRRAEPLAARDVRSPLG